MTVIQILKFVICCIFSISSVVYCDNVTTEDYSKLRECKSELATDLNRIYGGEDALPGEFPHQVSLQIRFFNSHICGGTLITDRWVLTAAHCFTRGAYPYHWQIKLGKHRLSKNETTERTMRVDKVILHEKYNKTNNVFDIALMKLSKKVNFTGTEKHLKRICLATEEQQNEVLKRDYKCLATGWGRGNKGRGVTDTLQKLPQPIHGPKKCKEIWKKVSWPVTEDHICIGNLKGKKGVCNGDSGGPIQCQLHDGNWIQFGIASWTINDCISEGYAAVFTKVSSYLNWIKEKIEDDTNEIEKLMI